jgi:alpha-glucosidase
VAAAHDHGIKVVLDFVPNHTSDLHPWFEESRAARVSPKRDWYIWRDGNPPNNWVAVFGGPAWEWDEETGQRVSGSLALRPGEGAIVALGAG